jgi:hypothetical protein
MSEIKSIESETPAAVAGAAPCSAIEAIECLTKLVKAARQHFSEKKQSAYYEHGWTRDYNPQDVRLWKAAGIEDVSHYDDNGLLPQSRGGSSPNARTERPAHSGAQQPETL